MKKNSIKKGNSKLLLILSVILVVLLVLLILGKTFLTGNIIYKSYCSDSDGGQNFLLRGIVNINTPEKDSYNSYTDACRNSTQLLEYFCKTPSASSVSINITNCQYGCLTGACSINRPINGVCGETLNTCKNNTLFNDVNDSDYEYNWQCSGLFFGANASCNISKSANYALGEDVYLIMNFTLNRTNIPFPLTWQVFYQSAQNVTLPIYTLGTIVNSSPIYLNGSWYWLVDYYSNATSNIVLARAWTNEKYLSKISQVADPVFFSTISEPTKTTALLEVKALNRKYYLWLDKEVPIYSTSGELENYLNIRWNMIKYGLIDATNLYGKYNLLQGQTAEQAIATYKRVWAEDEANLPWYHEMSFGVLNKVLTANVIAPITGNVVNGAGACAFPPAGYSCSSSGDCEYASKYDIVDLPLIEILPIIPEDNSASYRPRIGYIVHQWIKVDVASNGVSLCKEFYLGSDIKKYGLDVINVANYWEDINKNIKKSETYKTVVYLKSGKEETLTFFVDYPTSSGVRIIYDSCDNRDCIVKMAYNQVKNEFYHTFPRGKFTRWDFINGPNINVASWLALRQAPLWFNANCGGICSEGTCTHCDATLEYYLYNGHEDYVDGGAAIFNKPGDRTDYQKGTV